MPYMIGDMEDAVLGEKQAMFVLDGAYNEVKVYDGQGEFSHTFGGVGRGPDEFQEPSGLAIGNGFIFVADRHQRIKVFDARDNSYRGTKALDFTPEDLCVLGDRLYVRGYRESGDSSGRLVHVYEATAADEGILGSLGKAYESTNALVRTTLSRGSVACVEEERTVVLAFDYLPVAIGLSLEGEIRWVTEVNSYKPAKLTETSRNGRFALRHEALEPGTWVQGSVASGPGGLAILQMYEVQGSEERPLIHTFLLSSEDGTGTYAGSDLPRLFAFEEGRILGGTVRPFPQLLVLEVTQEPGV